MDVERRGDDLPLLLRERLDLAGRRRRHRPAAALRLRLRKSFLNGRTRRK